jgi:hypothetical protein
MLGANVRRLHRFTQSYYTENQQDNKSIRWQGKICLNTGEICLNIGKIYLYFCAVIQQFALPLRQNSAVFFNCF